MDLKKENGQKWIDEIMQQHRHEQELIWMIEDVKKMSKEELEFSIQKTKEHTEANKNKIEFNWQGKKIIQKKPFGKQQ
jgi:hypothetical protein